MRSCLICIGAQEAMYFWRRVGVYDIRLFMSAKPWGGSSMSSSMLHLVHWKLMVVIIAHHTVMKI